MLKLITTIMCTSFIIMMVSLALGLNELIVEKKSCKKQMTVFAVSLLTLVLSIAGYSQFGTFISL